MSVYQRETDGVFYTDFWFKGTRIQESTGTTRKTIAKEYERNRRIGLERAFAGLPSEAPAQRVRTVASATKDRLANLVTDSRESVNYVRQRLKHVDRLLGTCLVSDLNEDRIREYMRLRTKEGASNRTQNMEIQNLAQALGHTWKALWPKLRRKTEREDVGIAFSPEDQTKILAHAPLVQSPNFQTYIRLLLLTAMRSDKEALNMQWKHVDFGRAQFEIAKSKTAGGVRVLPMNDELVALLRDHREKHKERFGSVKPDHYLFPMLKEGKQRGEASPTKRTGSFKKAWASLKEETGVEGRLHDCRHTVLTRLAESGAPDSVIMAIAGHLSRRMLERYSHIRMKAKRDAMDTIRLSDYMAQIHTPMAGANRVPEKVPENGEIEDTPIAVNR